MIHIALITLCCVATTNAALVPDPGPTETARSERYAVTVGTGNGQALESCTAGAQPVRSSEDLSLRTEGDVAEPCFL